MILEKNDVVVPVSRESKIPKALASGTLNYTNKLLAIPKNGKKKITLQKVIKEPTTNYGIVHCH